LAMSGAGKSYLISVLLEELLQRKKEDGRLAVILMDVHGEYRSFAEPTKDAKYKDFSSNTKYLKASEIKIGVPKLSSGMIAGMVSNMSGPQKRDLDRILLKLRREMKDGLGPFDFNAVKSEIIKDPEMKDSTRQALIGWIITLEQLNLFGKTDNPSVNDLVRPGELTIIDLSEIIDLKKKQIIVAYFARKLFNERRNNRVPPFSMIIEEAHQFCPEGASREAAISRGIIETIAREGRKFGASICLISQRPINLSTTALSQCNTHIILRVTNPYDLKHIGETSEGLDSRSLDMITSLRTGEALMVGEAVNYPVFFKVRKRTSQESRHEKTLEQASKEFEELKEESKKEIEDLL
ncbi:ATP-binding protein, partial [archaeon]|nr:ATP-binding protein [archaeon]